MIDAAFLNRNFLYTAREEAKKPSGQLTTGLSVDMLKRIGEMSNSDIETLAANMPLSAFTLRLSESMFDHLLESSKKKSNTGSSYIVSALSR